MIKLIYYENQVLLKNPEFRDSVGLRLQTIVGRSYNNTAYSFVNPNPDKILRFQFRNMSRVQVRNLFNFLLLSKGNKVWLIDHNNAAWLGYVTTNPIASTHVGINNSDVALEFEGQQVA